MDFFNEQGAEESQDLWSRLSSRMEPNNMAWVPPPEPFIPDFSADKSFKKWLDRVSISVEEAGKAVHVLHPVSGFLSGLFCQNDLALKADAFAWQKRSVGVLDSYRDAESVGIGTLARIRSKSVLAPSSRSRRASKRSDGRDEERFLHFRGITSSTSARSSHSLA
nr:hypothetical protein Iba_chr13dCG5920 [Ipomoea batatas]